MRKVVLVAAAVYGDWCFSDPRGVNVRVALDGDRINVNASSTSQWVGFGVPKAPNFDEMGKGNFMVATGHTVYERGNPSDNNGRPTLATKQIIPETAQVSTANGETSMSFSRLLAPPGGNVIDTSQNFKFLWAAGSVTPGQSGFQAVNYHGAARGAFTVDWKNGGNCAPAAGSSSTTRMVNTTVTNTTVTTTITNNSANNPAVVSTDNMNRQIILNSSAPSASAYGTSSTNTGNSNVTTTTNATSYGANNDTVVNSTLVNITTVNTTIVNITAVNSTLVNTTRVNSTLINTTVINGTYMNSTVSTHANTTVSNSSAGSSVNNTRSNTTVSSTPVATSSYTIAGNNAGRNSSIVMNTTLANTTVTNGTYTNITTTNTTAIANVTNSNTTSVYNSSTTNTTSITYNQTSAGNGAPNSVPTNTFYAIASTATVPPTPLFRGKVVRAKAKKAKVAKGKTPAVCGANQVICTQAMQNQGMNCIVNQCVSVPTCSQNQVLCTSDMQARGMNCVLNLCVARPAGMGSSTYAYAPAATSSTTITTTTNTTTTNATIAGGSYSNANTQTVVTVSKFVAYPGSNYSTVVAGTITMKFVNTSVSMDYHLGNTDARCVRSIGVPNSCGLHIHVGKTCSNATEIAGHFYDNSTFPSDPWNNVTYVSNAQGAANGAANANYGYSYAQSAGRSVIVHDQNGNRMACAIIPEGAVVQTLQTGW